ncbi:MAG: TetR/AcrR family transcriptional regulator, partial [Streptococcaceae bacterium]|nr:TetR/AcrR family transcriptional regulator [Streptococcaceae bacterium]
MTKNTKEKITNAFLNLAQKAQGKTITIGDICKRAGVTRPTFYRYFDTLDALLAELREELDKEVFDVLTSYSPTEQTHSFEIITEQVLPILYANRTKLRIIYTSFVDPQWVKFLETRYAEWMRPFFRGKETLHGLHNDFLVA